MSRLNTGNGLAESKWGGLKLPRRPIPRQAWAIALLALAVVTGAAIVTMRAMPPTADGGRPQVPSTVVAQPAIPEKWRELQKPLPPITQAGKDEESISFPPRADDDPFAPDSSIARYYRTQGQRPGPASAEPATGPDEVSRIIAAASAKNASKAATKPSVPAEKPPAKPKEDAKPSSPPVPEPLEPATVAQLPPTPAPAPEEAPRAEEGSVAAEPAGKTGTAEPGRPREAATGESASPAGNAHAGEVVQASEPSQAASEKPSAGNDAGKPGTAKPPVKPPAVPPAEPPPVADKGGGSTVPGALSTSKGAPTVKESGRESVPPEPVAPPRPRVEPPLMLVTGIISAGDSAYAIVKTPQGSSIVRPGDEVGGVTVKSVGEKSITVIKEGEEFVLELGGGSKR